MHEMLNDVFKKTKFDEDHVEECSTNDDAFKFYGDMRDANRVVYPDCFVLNV